jgi:hypothetical protein
LENEVQLVVTVAEQVGKVTGAGGLTEVLRTVNCGFVSVSESDSYVPAVTLPKLRMSVKSTKLAKSTGWLGAVSVADVPPPCGTRAAELIVTTNDCTSQLGWSVPKTTSDPIGPVDVLIVPPPVPLPHPDIRTVARPTTSAGKKTSFALLMSILLESLKLHPNCDRLGSHWRQIWAFGPTLPHGLNGRHTIPTWGRHVPYQASKIPTD